MKKILKKLFLPSLCMLATVPVVVFSNVTVSGELQRMSSADHLYRPQQHRLIQYSGFSRKGGNPDRFDCLYIEDGWRVVADHEGPGVVSRIWTTHGHKWRDIKVELDGKVIFEGNASKFFGQQKYPFMSPFTQIRSADKGGATIEGEKPGLKNWGVSYLPMPFQSRFRYMQRDKIYANINIKELKKSVKVQSFNDTDFNKIKDIYDYTSKLWTRTKIYESELNNYEKVSKKIKIRPWSKKATTFSLNGGPSIIRAIRVKANHNTDMDDLQMTIKWDDSDNTSFKTYLGRGFGSRNERTFATGKDNNGWRYLYLPMPFNESAQFKFKSSSQRVVTLNIDFYIERVKKLPKDFLYLNCYANEGVFLSKIDKFDFPNLPLKDFYYHNGYTALNVKGYGHIVAYMDLFECQPELDEHIFFDEEKEFPKNSWNGTGHEDLFDMAWGHKSHSAPMTSGGSEKMQEVNVKLFWNDPMTFQTAIKFNWEWAYKFGINPPLDANFASVVYWYGANQE
ncbi:DUF2961 domain-containing protein [Lentisphaerota bacterium WC36G]|nr:DUF2961 domain-containing protein [Lentisphaerae bacterium WC36]